VKGLATLVLILAAGMVSYPSDAFPRDSGVRKAFQRAHPCPSTGKKTGACPGYVVDHIRPRAGGPDTVAKLQWQTVAESKKKDRLEAAECRELRTR
jgi:hypothetical protein